MCSFAMTDSTPKMLSVASDLDIQELVEDWATHRPADTFLAWIELDPEDFGEISWNAAHQASLRLAEYLHHLGIQAGDTICLHVENRPEAVLLLLACSILGTRLAPTNWKLTAAELSYIVRDSGARVIFADDAYLEIARDAVGEMTSFGVVSASELRNVWQGDSRRHVSSRTGALRFRDRPPQPGLEDRVILYTSGTTSAPKGVLISEAALIHAGWHIATSIGYTGRDRNLTVLPMCHINGLCYNVMTALVMGGSLCIVQRFSATRYWRHAKRASATVGWLAGTPMRMLLSKPASPADSDHPMRLVVYGQNLTRSGFAAWRPRFGTDLLQIYGTTETVTLPIANPLHGRRDDEAMGRPASGVLARVVGDEGVDQQSEMKGELQLKLIPGHQMMTGYLNNDVATAEKFTEDGWFRTGDVVRVGESGLLYFVDRVKDIIKVKGENVAASEVEHVLLSHPAVTDCAVTGIPDKLTDEAIVAFVVLAEDALDLNDVWTWVRERLAHFKIPVAIHPVASLPRTSTGKVQKSLLVERTLSSE